MPPRERAAPVRVVEGDPGDRGRDGPTLRGDPDRARRHRTAARGAFALERRDVDLDAERSQHRASTRSVLKEPKAHGGRRVPLRARRRRAPHTAAASRHSPPFPAARGGFIDDNKWRWRVWTPHLRAAGIEHRRIYDCRHTFASWAIAGGVQLFYLARIMGTSVAQIDATYGHLLPDSEDYLRGLLDAYDDVRGLTADQAGPLTRPETPAQTPSADERT